MSTDKCFCHFMGYRVKDPIAQKLIEENKDNVFEKNKNERLKFWVGTEEEYKSLTEKEDNCLYITTDDDIQKTVDDLKAECLSAISGFNQVLYEDETGKSTGLMVEDIDVANYSLFAVTLDVEGTTNKDVTILGYKHKYNDTDDNFRIYFNFEKLRELTVEGDESNVIRIYDKYYAELNYMFNSNSLFAQYCQCIRTREGSETEFLTPKITKIVGIM